MVPDFLEGKVKSATEIPASYERNASWQGMDVYLADWQAAKRRLDRRIEVLKTLRDARQAEAEVGTWPHRSSEVNADLGDPTRWTPMSEHTETPKGRSSTRSVDLPRRVLGQTSGGPFQRSISGIWHHHEEAVTILLYPDSGDDCRTIITLDCDAAEALADDLRQLASWSRGYVARCDRCDGTGDVSCPGPETFGMTQNELEASDLRLTVDYCYGMHMGHPCPDCLGTGRGNHGGVSGNGD